MIDSNEYNMNRQCMTRKPIGGNTMKTALTVEERKFMKESVELTLKAYYNTAEFYSKYTSTHSTNRVAINKALYLELVNAHSITDRKKQQNVYIKHLSSRAEFLNNYTSTDEAKVNRCKIVGSKILELNKKLRRIKKEESTK